MARAPRGRTGGGRAAGELVSLRLPNLIEDVLLGELAGLITRRPIAAVLIIPISVMSFGAARRDLSFDSGHNPCKASLTVALAAVPRLHAPPVGPTGAVSSLLNLPGMKKPASGKLTGKAWILEE